MEAKISIVAFIFTLFFCQFVEEYACFRRKPIVQNKIEKGRKTKIQDGSILKGLNEFAFSFHKTLPKDGSMFYSPFGIASTLAMAFAGSSGKTRKEIATALGWNDYTSKEIHATMYHLFLRLRNIRGGKKSFQTANSIWVERQETVRKNFKKLIENYYGGKFAKANFYGDPEGSRKKINSWVKEKTKGTIKDLIPEGAISSDTRLVLTNAVFFKALWEKPFDKRQTKSRKFYLSSNKAKEIPMMQGYFEVPFLKSAQFTGIELPYKGGRFSMVVLLPNSKEGLAEAEKNLDYESLEKSYQEKVKMNVVLPKFKISASYELVEKLRALKIKTLFSNECDLSRMLRTGGNIFVTDAVHKAFVSVNEHGTTASAATAMYLGRSFVPTFVANRPFVFFIKDTVANVILFGGRFSPS